jgi:hypothetical protein
MVRKGQRGGAQVNGGAHIGEGKLCMATRWARVGSVQVMEGCAQ